MGIFIVYIFVCFCVLLVRVLNSYMASAFNYYTGILNACVDCRVCEMHKPRSVGLDFVALGASQLICNKFQLKIIFHL